MTYDIEKEEIYGRAGEYQMVTVGDLKMGIPVMQIQEFKDISSLPPITEIPFDLDYVKGLINVRGKVLPAIGLREYKGLGSYLQERLKTIEMLESIEEDHVKWLGELKRCVKENTPITVEKDHTKCRFGEWYYSYQSDSFDIMAQLLRFEEPHREIHSIAERVDKLIQDDKHDAAVKLIESTKDTALNQLQQLFNELYEILRTSTREILIIIKGYFGEIGLIVDSVQNKYHLNKDDIQMIEMQEDYKLIGRTDEILMDLFDAENIMLEDILKLLRE